MKKYMSVLFVFSLFIILLGFNVKSVGAFASGCTSNSGWSSTTGNACDGSTPVQPTYPSGCTSVSGYSSRKSKEYIQ